MTERALLKKILTETLEKDCGGRCMDDSNDREETVRDLLRALEAAGFLRLTPDED